jgi:hypothetical protein
MPEFDVRNYNWVLVKDAHTVEAESEAEALLEVLADPYGQNHYDTQIIWESSCLQSWEAGEPEDDPFVAVFTGVEPPEDRGSMIVTRTGFLGIRRPHG